MEKMDPYALVECVIVIDSVRRELAQIADGVGVFDEELNDQEQANKFCADIDKLRCRLFDVVRQLDVFVKYNSVLLDFYHEVK